MKIDSNFLDWVIQRKRFVILIIRLILIDNKIQGKMKRKKKWILVEDIYKVLQKRKINSVIDNLIDFSWVLSNYFTKMWIILFLHLIKNLAILLFIPNLGSANLGFTRFLYFTDISISLVTWEVPFNGNVHLCGNRS